MSEKIRHRDALYLFACHLEWHTKGNLAAYLELMAALDDQDGAFAVLQILSCTEARHGPSELRLLSNAGEGRCESKNE